VASDEVAEGNAQELGETLENKWNAFRHADSSIFIDSSLIQGRPS
jgi:hypothetical protein